MISRNEILTYFGITLSLLLIVSIPAFISDNPDLSVPDRREQITTTSTQSTTTSKTTSSSTTFSPPQETESGSQPLFSLRGHFLSPAVRTSSRLQTNRLRDSYRA